MADGVQTTWEQFIKEVQALAIQNKTGYIIYEIRGQHGYMSDEERKQRQGRYPGRLLATVDAPSFFDGQEIAWVHLAAGIEAIHSDKAIRLRGAQPGNTNAKKGRYPRRVISHVGPDYDLVIDALKVQSIDDPESEQVLEAMNAAFRQVYGQEGS